MHPKRLCLCLCICYLSMTLYSNWCRDYFGKSYIVIGVGITLVKNELWTTEDLLIFKKLLGLVFHFFILNQIGTCHIILLVHITPNLLRILLHVNFLCFSNGTCCMILCINQFVTNFYNIICNR